MYRQFGPLLGQQRHLLSLVSGVVVSHIKAKVTFTFHFEKERLEKVELLSDTTSKCSTKVYSKVIFLGVSQYSSSLYSSTLSH